VQSAVGGGSLKTADNITEYVFPLLRGRVNVKIPYCLGLDYDSIIKKVEDFTYISVMKF